MKDPSFYVEMKGGKPALKKTTAWDITAKYSSRSGSHNLPGSILLFYFFKGIIITRVQFDEIYFRSLVSKSTDFYFKHFLHSLVQKRNAKNRATEPPFKNNLPCLASNFIMAFLKATKCTN